MNRGSFISIHLAAFLGLSLKESKEFTTVSVNNFVKTRKYSWMYKITNMNTRLSCFISHNKCRLTCTVIISRFYIKNDSKHSPHNKCFPKNQRLPFVWLKCSVKIIKSRNWKEKWKVPGNDRFSRVPGYPDTQHCLSLGIKLHVRDSDLMQRTWTWTWT